MIVSTDLPLSLPARYRWLSGTRVSQTPPWLMPFWIALFIILIVWLYRVSLKESWGQYGPCRSVDVQYLNRCFFSLSDRHAPLWVIVFPVLRKYSESEIVASLGLLALDNHVHKFGIMTQRFADLTDKGEVYLDYLLNKKREKSFWGFCQKVWFRL